MIVSIHQPDYIPYMGFFYKVAKSDKFVFLDDCQFSNDNMHHWNRVKTPQGECRLKVPVEQHLGDSICAVRTRDELGWKKKHLKTLEMNYKKAAFFEEVFPEFEKKLSESYASLAEQNIAINTWLIQQFGMTTEIYISSEMDIHTVREERVLDICEELGADVYFSGNGAKAYQKEEDFRARNIELRYTDFSPMEYRQQWGTFVPNLSVLDYIFNCGFSMDFMECGSEK